MPSRDQITFFCDEPLPGNGTLDGEEFGNRDGGNWDGNLVPDSCIRTLYCCTWTLKHLEDSMHWHCLA